MGLQVAKHAEIIRNSLMPTNKKWPKIYFKT